MTSSISLKYGKFCGADSSSPSTRPKFVESYSALKIWLPNASRAIINIIVDVPLEEQISDPGSDTLMAHPWDPRTKYSSASTTGQDEKHDRV